MNDYYSNDNTLKSGTTLQGKSYPIPADMSSADHEHKDLQSN